MARNVSNQEIDALLATEEAPRPTVAARDFAEPRRFAATDLESLRRPAETAGAAVAEALRFALPLEIALEGVEVGELSLDAALRGAEAGIVGALAQGPGGPSLVTLDPAGAVLIAELALGADGSTAPEARALSPIESGLLERLLARLLERATQPFQIGVKDARLVQNRTAFARELGTDGDRRRFCLRIALVLGEARLVVQALLAGVKAPAPKAAPSAASKDARKAALPPELAPTHVAVSAVLARTDILLTELLALEPGDVIPLAIRPGEPIEIEIEGEPRARARFGERNGRVAVRLTEILRTPAKR